jgi:hypothetical protein
MEGKAVAGCPALRHHRHPERAKERKTRLANQDDTGDKLVSCRQNETTQSRSLRSTIHPVRPVRFLHFGVHVMFIIAGTAYGPKSLSLLP